MTGLAAGHALISALSENQHRKVILHCWLGGGVLACAEHLLSFTEVLSDM